MKDAKTGQGLANTEIRSDRFAGTNYIGIMTLRTKTDGQGRFRLAGMPKGKGNQIIIVPNDEQPYFMQEVKVPDPPGAGPVEVSSSLSSAGSGSKARSPRRRPVGPTKRPAPLLSVPREQVRSDAPGVSLERTTPTDSAFKTGT